jgi:hypothetical protein
MFMKNHIQAKRDAVRAQRERRNWQIIEQSYRLVLLTTMELKGLKPRKGKFSSKLVTEVQLLI